ncbi:hypothetical protein K0M31_002069, partial [Melipona bicolor]
NQKTFREGISFVDVGRADTPIRFFSHRLIPTAFEKFAGKELNEREFGENDVCKRKFLSWKIGNVGGGKAVT